LERCVRMIFPSGRWVRSFVGAGSCIKGSCLRRGAAREVIIVRPAGFHVLDGPARKLLADVLAPFECRNTAPWPALILARGAVAFLLFPLPKPSVEAEQRQQMVPRALRPVVRSETDPTSRLLHFSALHGRVTANSRNRRTPAREPPTASTGSFQGCGQ
jgi:hypothetical protein